MIRYYFRQLGKSERGATLIEFALIALLLFTILFGIIEFGWLFFGWITLTGAVREGARLAVVGEDGIKETIERHASAIELDANSPSVTTSGSGLTRTVTVTATGEIPLITGLFAFLSNTGNNTFRLSAESTMRYESGTVPETVEEEED